jgi:FixJ family two-component response regulator
MLHRPQLSAPPQPSPAAETDFAIYLIERELGRRVALAQDLRELGFVVRPFPVLDDFAAASMEIEPGVVILDVAMLPAFPVLDNDRLAAGYPTILLFDRLESEHAVQAVRSGAVDLIRWPGPLDELAEAVRRAAAKVGEHRMRLEAAQVREEINHLSRRERDVLRLIVRGLSNKEMARQLGLSPRTVEMHRSKLYRKLGVSTAAPLVVIAMRGGGVDWI